MLIQRITPILDVANVPQSTQTAYRKGVSSRDSIFASQEANARFIREGEKVYSCYYDLASAFDTVEFSVILEELYHAGVRGKCWRLVRQWYQDLRSQVKLGFHLSRCFSISQGIRQGSVLSPSLFNLVLDPLLSTLKQRNLGLSINGLYLGSFAHADDIRTSSANLEDALEQVMAVDNFTKSRSLRLCPEKCALITSNNTLALPSHFKFGDTCLQIEDSVKCLDV